jgi:hypothetical protein
MTTTYLTPALKKRATELADEAVKDAEIYLSNEGISRVKLEAAMVFARLYDTEQGR